MEKYRLIVKPVYRKKFTGIMCFLADQAYTDDDIRSGKNRTTALCWVAYKDDIERMMNKYQNINVIITAELLRWQLEYKGVIDELTPLTSSGQLGEMITTMENFIRNTISDLYD
ncbi:hypothetical protein [Pedobacter hartonius]|uniref:Uncharacterized protein n=1 Tax=Pedobacter hartonius TaxID=425514 RepID=A0A1H4H9D8_9SPHI|nr:hypothetical protein [Pedobacter hartonius]SEB18414.1 hypothetical protein SAMN05443550_114103 [Pedobacter hartonius]